ncbi:hypothetical protein BJ170DRAFT_365852 [Xylariales sp. AK1849]|nr:hypothetical protein BJ170DRAFT_365852 [Xylariales sp. AK1849]
MHSQQLIVAFLSALPILVGAVPQNRASTTLKTSTTKAAAGTKASSAPASAASAAATGNASSNITMSGVVSDIQIANAVSSWQNNTGKVTRFLDTATSLTGDDFTKQATIALNAEKDELNHKMVLDAAMGMNPAVQDANNVLAMQGTFQKVVDVLQKMADSGPDTAQADVNDINNNRCVNVLPNIDKYFSAAGSSTVTASRPTGCLEVTAAPAATDAGAAGAATGTGASVAATTANANSAAAAPSAAAPSSPASAAAATSKAATSKAVASASGTAKAAKSSSAAAAKTTSK